ncbi:MAG: hypothetical protein FVQ83_03555 [Chloroflexi bacterium]|nr:hypothetical protein [Chloroflexota bacterium]
MDTKIIGTWSYLICLVLAMLTVFVRVGDWSVQVLIILGILAGGFHHKKGDLIRIGLAYLVLRMAGETMGELIAVGPYISDIVTAWVNFLGPVVLTAYLIWGTPQLIAAKNK